MNQTSENGEKPNFGLDFGLFVPNLWPEFFFHGVYFILYLFIYLFIYLFKIWLRWSLDIVVRYQHVKYKKNLMIQSWENFVTNGQTDRRTDRLTDEREWFHKTLSHWRQVLNILVEKRLFSEMNFVWTTSRVIGKHSF